MKKILAAFLTLFLFALSARAELRHVEMTVFGMD